MKQCIQIVIGLLVMFTHYLVSAQVTVTLTTPPYLFLVDETVVQKVAVSNGTDESFNVYKSMGTALGRQFYWCITPVEKMESLIRNDRILQAPDNRAWVGLRNLWDENQLLPSGGTHEWDTRGQNMLPPQIFEYYPEVSLYAQVLVGSNVWVCSNTNSVRMLPKSVDTGVIRFEGGYVGYRNFFRSFKVYEHVLDDKTYLFANYCRLCEVPSNTVPWFSVNTNAAILTVSFSSTNSPPVVFDLKNDQIIP
jgi:hypothetical protein